MRTVDVAERVAIRLLVAALEAVEDPDTRADAAGERDVREREAAAELVDETLAGLDRDTETLWVGLLEALAERNGEADRKELEDTLGDGVMEPEMGRDGVNRAEGVDDGEGRTEADTRGVIEDVDIERADLDGRDESDADTQDEEDALGCELRDAEAEREEQPEAVPSSMVGVAEIDEESEAREDALALEDEGADRLADSLADGVGAAETDGKDWLGR